MIIEVAIRVRKRGTHMLSQNFVETITATLRTNWDVKCFSNLDGDTTTYGEVADRILRLHEAFAELGIQRGDRVAVVGRNSINWAVTYLATITYGAVIVPVLPDFTSAEIEHIVRHSESSVLVVADAINDRLDEQTMPSLNLVLRLADFSVFWSANDKYREAMARSLMTWREKAPDVLAGRAVDFPAVSNEELAAIVYTSGTTGFSKGVMLNHNSLMANVAFFTTCIEMNPGDNIVSFLPLAHAFGCAFDFLSPFAMGCHVTFIEQVPTPKVLLPAFARLKPVVVMSVPLIIEKIYKNKIKPVIEKPRMKMLLKVPGLNKLIHNKIRDQIYGVFGANYKEMVIGGAALNRDIEKFFREIGVNITCGYGMTEFGPLMSYTVSADNPPAGSVGKVIPYLECHISDPDPETGIGEVLMRGENRMLGYYQDEEATAETIDADGWLHTGDLGRLDDDGHLFLTGRSKNMILTASGQNVYPEEIESQLNNMRCVEESLILEDAGRLVALVYPDLESVDRACLRGQQVEDLMEENRKSLNLKLPGYCQISRLKVLYEEFEKTPTKKIKRRLYNALA